jgi:hypothetical protein
MSKPQKDSTNPKCTSVKASFSVTYSRRHQAIAIQKVKPRNTIRLAIRLN